ncbi:hypothetical protein ES703_60467 [subsurface metagenome]
MRLNLAGAGRLLEFGFKGKGRKMAAVDIKWDIALENAGGFFCEACLGVKTVDERSQDPRYCQGCYNFLIEEAKLLSGPRRSKWIPKPEKTDKALEKQCHVARVGDGILSTLESPKIELDKIKPSVEPEPVSQKGRKKPVLPVGDIGQLSFEGMGAKAIAPQLRKRNAKVSHKTAQRVLSGERT